MGDQNGNCDEGESTQVDEPARDGPPGVLQPLVDVLDGLLTIAERDRLTDESGGLSTESGASVSSVDDVLDRRRTEADSEGDAGSGSEPQATTAETAEGYHVRAEFDGEEFVVVADLLGASMEEISAGLARGGRELVVQREGSTVARVDLPWAATTTRAWFNNGILEIRLRDATP